MYVILGKLHNLSKKCIHVSDFLMRLLSEIYRCSWKISDWIQKFHVVYTCRLATESETAQQARVENLYSITEN